MRLAIRWAASWLLVTQALTISAAHAEVTTVPRAPTEEGLSYERANALFQEGRRLVALGRHQEACEHFEQSLTIEDAIGTKFNLADCWEKIGRTASAQSLFAEVAEKTQNLGQAERARIARERAAALETRLSRLVIDVEAPVPGLSIQRNDGPVARRDWGATLAVDPGTYEIRASAPGKSTWSRHVSVSSRNALVWVSVPRLADAPARSSALARATHEAPGLVYERSRAPSPEALRTWRPVAFGLGALGLGGLAAGTVFALKYRSSNDAARAICSGAQSCPRDQIDRHAGLTSEARAARNGAYVSFGLGAAALAGTAVVYFAVPLYRASEMQVSAHPGTQLDGSWTVSASGFF